MTFMKGILLKEPNGDYSLVDNVEKPSPGPKQILVKSLVTAMNPVESYMKSGVLVTAWPIVLGCDASGTVVEVGSGVKKFKKGDGVFGCTALGIPGNSTFQEYFVMNETLTFKKPSGLTTEQAATVGVGLLTAGLGLISGTKIDLKSKPIETGASWVIVLGAAGSVGQFAVQLGKLCGYKILAACSPSNNKIVMNAGADATLNYKLTLQEQLAEIKSITGGNFSRVFDASAQATETGIEALAQLGDKGASMRYFATTNDWQPIDPKDGIDVYKVTLGDIGREGNEHIKKVNGDIAAMIPKLETLLEAKQLKPLEYVQIGDVGVEQILKAIEAFDKHKSGKKVIVRVAGG